MGRGDSAAPPHERFSPGKFGSEARAEAAAQGEPGGCPRRGARLQRSPGRLGLRARSRRQGHALGSPPSPVPPRPGVWAPRLRNTPLSRRPAARALRRSRAPGGVPRPGAGCRALPQRLGSPGRTAGRGSSLPAGEEAPGFAAQGPGPGWQSSRPQSSLSLLPPLRLRRGQRERPRLRAPRPPRCQVALAR